MTPEESKPASEETQPEATEEAGTATPLNRAERRAQAQGKKNDKGSGSAFGHAQPTNLRGMMSRGSKAGKTLFPRTGHK